MIYLLTCAVGLHQIDQAFFSGKVRLHTWAAHHPIFFVSHILPARAFLRRLHLYTVRSELATTLRHGLIAQPAGPDLE